MGYIKLMYLTVAQTEVFQKHAADIWQPEALDAFVNWIALNPTAGDVIPDSGGLRKVRWTVSGRGKSGGARVIYYNLPVKVLKELKNAIPQKNR